MTYYKALNTDGSCHHGGTGTWSEDEWMPELDPTKLEPCIYGYHVLEEQDLIYWLGPAIAEVEIDGPVIRHENKLVVAKAKRGAFLSTWTPQTQRLFAADCAEHVLHIFTDKYPDDNRPAEAIAAARAFARGLISQSDLAKAHNAAHAADAAARTAYAAYAAARAAAYAAYAAYADAAARTAAYAAATDAAYAAARAAAYAAERGWQTDRLFQYLRGYIQ